VEFGLPEPELTVLYDLPALESNDGFTNAQWTLSLVFVFCCVHNSSLMLSSSFHEIVETILNIIYARLWWMLSNWSQWHLNHWILPNGWVCFCYRALEYRYIIIDLLLWCTQGDDARNSVHYVHFPLIYVRTGNICLLSYTALTLIFFKSMLRKTQRAISSENWSMKSNMDESTRNVFGLAFHSTCKWIIHGLVTLC